MLDYQPFGTVQVDQQFASYESPYTFTGKERDEESGLIYFEARYYGDTWGRFTSQDPVVLAMGTPSLKEKTGQELFNFLSNPQNLNSYAYVRNNPLRLVDPDGEFAVLALIALGAIACAFLCDAPAARAPETEEETARPAENKDFFEIVSPSYDSLAEWEKFGLGLVVGNRAGSARKGFVKLFHGTTDDFSESIIRHGFKDTGIDKTWLSNNLSDDARYYSLQRNKITNQREYGSVLEIDLPQNLLNDLIKKGEVEIRDRGAGVLNYGFTDKAKDMINQYLKGSPSSINKIKID